VRPSSGRARGARLVRRRGWRRRARRRRSRRAGGRAATARLRSRGAPPQPSARRAPSARRPLRGAAAARTTTCRRRRRERMPSRAGSRSPPCHPRRARGESPSDDRARSGPAPRRPNREATRPRRSGTPHRASPAAIPPARRLAPNSGAGRLRCATAAGSSSAAPTSGACRERRLCAVQVPQCSARCSSVSPNLPVYADDMPEGDSLHRAAARLQVLTGQKVEVEAPHPRASGKGLVEQLDGKTLESVEAVGKNLLLRFEGGLTLRSHLRMTGRWRVEQRGARRTGRPWLVLRGDTHEAVLWNGPVLELVRGGGRVSHLGPDILDRPPDLEEMLERFRAASQSREFGDAVLDQRLVAGIGNMWKAEALWDVRVSPWRALADVSDTELLAALDSAAKMMRAGVDGARPLRHIYRRAGRACHRCGGVIRSYPQGADARTAYWCPKCQVGGREPKA